MKFEIAMQMKHFFFDRQTVIDRMGRASRKALSKAGAFIRTRARSSLRRRKKPSPPGSPPSVHSRDSVATLKNILFAFGPHEQSLIVGPVKLNQREQDWITMGATTVPQIHEFGAVVNIHEMSRNKGKTWWRRDKRRNPRPWEIYRVRKAVYRPRPFMGPALEAEQDHIPDAWAGSVSK